MTAAGHQPDATDDPYLPRHGDRTFGVDHYRLDLEYRLDGNHLTGRAHLLVTTIEDVVRLRLDLAGLAVQKVTVDRRPVHYVHRAGSLRIELARPVRRGTQLQVEVRYSGRPRPVVGTWGDVGWEELHDGVIVASQPSGAPSWFPCNDRPDDKASYTIRVTTDAAHRVIANGELTDRHVHGGRVMWQYEQREPMATYLATVQIGRYDWIELRDTTVDQRGAVPARLRARFDAEFARQPEMMSAFIDLFGPYPFGSYTVVVTDDDLEIPLEAQGLSVFGANHIDGNGTFQRLIAHELAHQWFGNSLTVARWQDVWLHEGFACYAEWLWSERSGSTSANDLARAAWRRLRALPQDLLVADPGPSLMFDDRLYKRGALALHALRVLVGDDTFAELLRAWVAGRQYGSVTTADFIDHADEFDPGAPAVLDAWLWRRELPAFPGAH